MEALTFLEMAEDKNAVNLKKMKYKYKEWFPDYLEILKSNVFSYLPLLDFSGNKVAFVPGQLRNSYVDLHSVTNSSLGSSVEEVKSSLRIENVVCSRASVQNVFCGKAPKTQSEELALGLKNGLEFIKNPKNTITEENLAKLYCLIMGVADGAYRDAPVYVVGETVEHTGLEAALLPKYMKAFVKYASADDEDPLVKACILHFYLAYVHPYFDGNGRMARLLHLWYLAQQGYTGAFYVPFSSSIMETKSDYYNAFTLIEENYKISGVIDVTPFILYFQKSVYPKMKSVKPVSLDSSFTVKEQELWDFVCSNYRDFEFTTKRLEKDFGNAAFATVRSFCLKFTSLGLLSSRSLSNKVLYKLK